MTSEGVHGLFLRAARGERTERPPIWLMRQAGRTDPAYLALRRECGLALEDLFRHPELAARVSLLPRRFGVDAIIYFQDILTPLAPMGAPFVFRPGPVLAGETWGTGPPALHTYDVAQALPFVAETFRLVRAGLAGALPVLGFAGAPLTLLFFILERGSFGERADRARAFLTGSPREAHALLGQLAEMTADYLALQVEAGADAVQLFESAAYLLSPAEYREFAVPWQQRALERVRGRVPTILFARDWPVVEDLGAAGADILSLPACIGIREARARLGEGLVVQGNLDNRLLATGPLEAIGAAARACVAEGECRGHIFNLSHGLLRETPFEHILHLIRVVQATG